MKACAHCGGPTCSSVFCSRCDVHVRTGRTWGRNATGRKPKPCHPYRRTQTRREIFEALARVEFAKYCALIADVGERCRCGHSAGRHIGGICTMPCHDGQIVCTCSAFELEGAARNDAMAYGRYVLIPTVYSHEDSPSTRWFYEGLAASPSAEDEFLRKEQA